MLALRALRKYPTRRQPEKKTFEKSFIKDEILNIRLLSQVIENLKKRRKKAMPPSREVNKNAIAGILEACYLDVIDKTVKNMESVTSYKDNAKREKARTEKVGS